MSYRSNFAGSSHPSFPGDLYKENEPARVTLAKPVLNQSTLRSAVVFRQISKNHRNLMWKAKRKHIYGKHKKVRLKRETHIDISWHLMQKMRKHRNNMRGKNSTNVLDAQKKRRFSRTSRWTLTSVLWIPPSLGPKMFWSETIQLWPFNTVFVLSKVSKLQIQDLQSPIYCWWFIWSSELHTDHPTFTISHLGLRNKTLVFDRMDANEVVTFCNLVVLTLLLDGRSNWSLSEKRFQGDICGTQTCQF